MHLRLVILSSVVAIAARFSLAPGALDVPETASELALGDVNADGKTDVAASNIEADTVTALETTHAAHRA
jgi:hypothetical protein